MAAGDGGRALGVAVSNPSLDGVLVSTALSAEASTSKLGFYGVAAVIRPTSSNEAAPASTAPVSISATQWGFSTSAQAQAVLTLVTQLRADLVTLGLITGS